MVAVSLVVLICFFAGTINGATGFGYGLVAIPLIGLVIDPQTSIVIGLAMGFSSAVHVALKSRAKLATRAALIMASVSLLIMPLGLWVAWQLSMKTLSFLIGVIVVAATLALTRGMRMSARTGTYISAGLLSGFLAPGTGMGGPPIVIAIQGTVATIDSTRRTSAAILCVQSAFAMGVIAAAGGIGRVELTFSTIALLPTIVGSLVGTHVFSRLKPKTTQRLVFFVLLASGASAIFHGLFGN